MLTQVQAITKLLLREVTKKILSVIFQILFTKYSSNENVCCDFCQSSLDLSNTTFFFNSIN